MNQLEIRLKNCYGIEKLETTLAFDNSSNRGRAIAIYAPNGLMKTSFTKTFANIAAGESPKMQSVIIGKSWY